MALHQRDHFLNGVSGAAATTFEVMTSSTLRLCEPDIFPGGAAQQIALGDADHGAGGIDHGQTAVTLPGRLRLNSSKGVRAAVLNDLGLAIVSEWLFRPELECGAVRAVLAKWTLPEIELWVVFPTGWVVNAKARAFAAFVQNEMDQHHSGPE